ncbi:MULTISPECIES: PIN domain-containing protein [unclassified Paenibacillus]|uniref:type II toxin-antitoxin system VapC family toxin n=1 Tax=unclassified Paenibacillus TaxID=185978 RepID=UPI0005639C50|nr:MULTISPECIES: PIN domain-containing protein [unclassified Paenibacillus]
MSDIYRVCLDTNIFIYVFEKHPQYGEKSKKILDLVEQGKIIALASTVTLTEILVKPLKEGQSNIANRYKVLFSHFPNLELLPVNDVVAQRAAALRATYGMKTPDALILATAIEGHAEAFVTNDLRLKDVEEIKCISIEELEVE